MESAMHVLIFSVLSILAVVSVTVGQETCKSGAECFPNHRGIPDDLTVQDKAYYCCLETRTKKQFQNSSDPTSSCTCISDPTLDEKIINWADNTKDSGRMCSRGEESCAGSNSNSTTSHRVLSCCWPQGPNQYSNKTINIFDGDKPEYIGCRCSTPIPPLDPSAYVVPPSSMYNSTGESCAYDKGCEERPFLKCKSPGVTFCCYGSRGMATENDINNNVTKCTCTNEVTGPECANNPLPIARHEFPCLSECSDHAEKDVCTDDSNSTRCCPHNLSVQVTLNNGNFSTCTCTTANVTSCGRAAPTSDDGSSAVCLWCHSVHYLAIVLALFVLLLKKD